jgi:putative alpha-1,2-mannosidase
MKFNLENGKTFIVRARNVSDTNIYIAAAQLNGVPYKKAFIMHDDLMKGGILEFTMSDRPVATAFTEFPASAQSPIRSRYRL